MDETTVTVSSTTGKTPPTLLVLATIVAVLVLSVDLFIPMSIAGGAPYVALIICGWWMSTRTAPLFLATIASALIIAGYLIVLDDAMVRPGFGDRGLVILVLWGVAVFLWRIKDADNHLEQEMAAHQRIENALLDTRNEMEKKFEERTRKLQQSQAWSSSVIKALEVTGEGLFVVSDQYKIEHMNQVLIDMFGDRTGETCYQAVADRNDPCDYCKLSAVTQNGETLSYEPVIANGKTFSIFATPFENADGSTSKLEVINDITALREEEQKLVDAVESISEGFVLYDSNDRLIICNSRFKEFYGYSDDDAKPGVHAHDLGLLDVERDIVLLNSAPENYIHRRGGRESREGLIFTVELKDGRILETHDEVTASGGLVSIQADVTQIKQARQELQKSHEELETRVEERTRELAHSMEKVEIANRAKSELMATVSHELRTPLNAIIGFSDFLKNESFGPIGHSKYKECVEDISNSGQHLLELISDILDASAIESGKLELQEDDLNLASLVDASLRLVNHRATEGSVQLKADLGKNLPRLHVDGRRIKQILLNMLSNAIKFTPAGGRVLVKTFLDENGAYVLTIGDTGVGMSGPELEKAMSEFGQVGRTDANKYEGTGLGLPLTKGLVELHGGTFDISSEKGAGTVVTITFPKERVVNIF
jgi:PAS domain S-box-containing protein